MPDDLHARSPIFLGTKSEVAKVEEFYKAMDEVRTEVVGVDWRGGMVVERWRAQRRLYFNVVYSTDLGVFP